MGFDIPFIHLPYMSAVFARLDRAVNSRSMIPVAGYHGAGRRRLLTEWATEAQTQVQPDQIVLVEVPDADLAAFGKLDVITPATIMTLWETFFALNELRGQRHRNRRYAYERKLGSIYSDSTFHTLSSEIRDAIKTLQLRALILHNAHHADARAVRELIRLRHVTNQRFAIIWSYQMQPNAKPHEGIRDVLRKANASAILTDVVELPKLEIEGFEKCILPDLLAALNADSAPEIEREYKRFQQRFWEHTQGNWHQIERMVTLFDEELGPSNGDVRIITRAVEEAVYRRLAGLAPFTYRESR